MPNEYDLSNESLINALGKATVRAGISNSGLVISASSTDDRDYALYLRGIVLARLDKQAPPFKAGDKVVQSETGKLFSVSLGPDNNFVLAEPKEYEVARVYYRRIELPRLSDWQIAFKEIEHTGVWAVFDAAKFTLAISARAAV